MIRTNRDLSSCLDCGSGGEQVLTALETFFGAVDMIHRSTDIKIVVAVRASIVQDTGIDIHITYIDLFVGEDLTGNTRKT